ncbi:MAG: UDP-3-O-(3-hydroxymyristoyl)glucosamine N-acyltransferase [Chitinophagaceae bacterium]
MLKKFLAFFLPSKQSIGKDISFSATQIANMLNGTVDGHAEVRIKNIAKIEKGTQGDLCFLSNMKYEPYLYKNQATATIVGKDFKPKQPIPGTLIRVDIPYSALTILLEKFNQYKKPIHYKTEKPSFIASSTQLKKQVYIGAFSYIGNNVKIGHRVQIYPHVYIGDNVQIGDDVILYSGVKIYHDCLLGNRIIIHSGAIIGADGFGFAKQEDGSYKKIPQIGNVIIEDDVEIGANTTIDRAVMNSTIVGKGVKLDNLIMIAHNVTIGENTAIAAQSGVAGSCKIGNNVIFAGQVGIAGHYTIANGTTIGAQSGIISNIEEENTTIIGSPAMNAREQLKVWSYTRKLPLIAKRIEKIEEELKNLKS